MGGFGASWISPMSPRRLTSACAPPGHCKPPPAAPWAQTSACSSASPWAAVWVAAVPMRRPAWWRSTTCGILHRSTDDLAALGLKLGADVPVFVRGRAAWAEGIGERLTPLYPPLSPPEANYLILKPNIGVSTAEVFQDPELTRNSAPITIHGFLESGGHNDCLGVVRRRYPEVASALDWLSGYGAARLTGTGACVFLAVDTMNDGRDILRKLPPALDAFLARGLNDSPLLERLATG